MSLQSLATSFYECIRHSNGIRLQVKAQRQHTAAATTARAVEPCHERPAAVEGAKRCRKLSGVAPSAGTPLGDAQAMATGLAPHCGPPGALSLSRGCAIDQPACWQSTLKEQIYRWDFSVFRLADECRGKPLQAVTTTLLDSQGLLDGWRLDRARVAAYLATVEAMYKPNPYHNATHAADVTQTAGVAMLALHRQLESRGGRGLDKLERFAVILASAVHDLAHPGVNNSFLIRSRDRTALTYNDRSVNEMMHASLAFSVALDNEALNIFASFPPDEYERLRRLVLDMVLSTDMDVHFALLQRFDDAVTASPDVATWDSVEQRSLLLQMLVHLADLANPSRPWHLALNWAEWVVSEFLEQGEREAQSGIGVSDMCNVDKVCMPAAQLFFIQRFMQPTLEAFGRVIPAFAALAAPWLEDTKAKWAVFRDAGVRLPRQGYPAHPGTGRDASPDLPAALGLPPPVLPQQQDEETLAA